MNSVKAKDTSRHNILDVKGAKAMFESSMRRQRAPSPAPSSMTSRPALTSKTNKTGGNASDSFSSYKERFEKFTAPKKESTDVPKAEAKAALRRASSEDNVNKTTSNEEFATRERARSNSSAEKHWFQARTKIYEKLSEQRSQADIDVKCTKNTPTLDRKKIIDSTPVAKSAEDKGENTSIIDRINKYKSDVETKKATSEKVPEMPEKQSAKVKDLKSGFVSPQMSRKDKTKSMSALDKFKILEHSTAAVKQSKDKSLQPTVAKIPAPKPINSQIYSSADDSSKHKLPEPKRLSMQMDALPGKSVEASTAHSQKKKPELQSEDSKVRKVSGGSATQSEDSKVRKVSGGSATSSGKSIRTSKDQHKKLSSSVVDHESALSFMVELVAAIDNEQHVPMKQLIALFEIMKKENGEMKTSIEALKTQLNKSELDSLSHSLETKLTTTVEQLQQAQEQVKELSVFREALRESEERCEELDELNQQYLDEIDELRLIMNEMRDQFHDDEIHETIILQQRLDDMARSLRIIHFRLKKADAKLQETEREKETLLEEIKLLQGGTFTDEEIRRMQSLEGDLQAAKEISVELHNQLQRSEERREKLEIESAQYREEIKAVNLENDRLRNNILHLGDQSKTKTDDNQLIPVVNLVRQGSADIDILKSNLEASIERENDIKEQLAYAEEEAKMLRKRLRDIEHENEALTKQLKKLSQVANHRGEKNGESSEHIQVELIQIENTQLRHDNDKLHQDIDGLRSQIKSLTQKLALVQDEQNEGPLSVMKNSIYYETKFELMTHEIEDLRQQLQDRDKDYRKLREETSGTSKRSQLRREIASEGDSIDALKQAAQSNLFRDKLQQLQHDNKELMSENGQLKALKGNNTTFQGESNNQLHCISSENSLKNSQTNANTNSDEKARVAAELEDYKKSRPEIAKLVNNLYDSEQKILTYEEEIANLGNDMRKMESSLQDDINSLTMKNSILRSLLEAINEHEEEDSNHLVTADDHQETKHSAARMSTSSRGNTSRQKVPQKVSSATAVAHNDIGSDNLVIQHINRLPQDLQNQFKKKIEYLESQLKEERERSMAAEGLLQQVKMSANTATHKRPVSKSNSNSS